jgi:hypothetical protein
MGRAIFTGPAYVPVPPGLLLHDAAYFCTTQKVFPSGSARAT